MRSDFTYTKILPVFAGFATSVLLAPMAMAQESGSSTTYTVNSDGTPEEVTVTSPRHPPMRSTIGAPYEEVSISVPVSYRDLNLHTGDGVYTLRQRVKYTARRACEKLEFRYPIGQPEGWSCYRRAMRNAMPQADVAVWNYRSPGTM